MNNLPYYPDIRYTERFEGREGTVLGSVSTYTVGVPCKEVRDFLNSFNLGRNMNDPAVKVALTISVLVGGIFIAIVFRPVFSTPTDATAQMNTPLNLQHQRQLPLPAPSQAQAPGSVVSAEQNSTGLSESSQAPTVLSPFGGVQPVPNLPPHYPATASTNSARWGMPMDMMPIVSRPADGPQVHKIVDGDTLGDLAARYLGSSARAMEIFQANRDVLTDPELLPIGTELKIPARGAITGRE